MLDFFKKLLSGKKGPKKLAPPLEKTFHYLVEEDAEVLGYLADKHSQQLKFINSFLEDALRTKESLKGDTDLVNLHFFSAQSSTNLAIAMNHMSLLSRLTLESVSRLLANKIARMDGKNEIPLATSFTIFPAAHRCRESSFVLRQLKDRIDGYLKDTVSSAVPFDLVFEDQQLWDNPFDTNLKSLPTYTGFYGLCGLILEGFEAYKDGARFEEVIAPEVLENASALIRINGHMLDVNLNGNWTRVSVAIDEIKRRSRSFNRKVHEIQHSFFSAVYPCFLLSLNYEYVIFSVLNLFPLESALKDAKVFMRWYSTLFPNPTDEMKSKLVLAESLAMGQKSRFSRTADELSARIRDIPRLDKGKAIQLADLFRDSLQEEFGVANGLVQFDIQLADLDHGLGELARKVWRVELKTNDFMVLPQFIPHSPLLEAQGGSKSPSLKPAFEEILLHRAQGKVLEVSSELSEALVALHGEFMVDILQSQMEAKKQGQAEVPWVQTPIKDIDSRVSLLYEEKS